MKGNSSVNSELNPYQRADAWIIGINGNAPLKNNFGDHLNSRIEKLIRELPNNSEWIRRAEDWRKVNGYPVR